MSVGLEVIEDVEALHALSDAWQALASEANSSPLFRGPRWLLAWWRAYQRQLDAELYTLAVFDEKKLVGLAPLYRRQATGSTKRKLLEIRLMGDAGPRPPVLGLLALPGYEESVGNAFGNHLAECSDDWDLLDLQPLEDPSKVRAFMVNRLSSKGRSMDSSPAGGVHRIELSASGVEADHREEDARASAYVRDPDQLRKGLATLRRLSRLEWANRDEASPFSDRQATHLMEDIALPLGKEDKARFARLNDQDGEAIAAALILDEGDRSVVLALAFDPEFADAPSRLLAAEAHAALARGQVSLDMCPSDGEYELPKLPCTQKHSVQLCVYGTSSSASLARTYGKLRRKVNAAKDAPGAAAAGARAAWSRIRTAAASVAGVERLHLYRGELWSRGLPRPPGLHLEMFSEDDFNALDSSAREQLLDGLELSPDWIAETWERGDIAVLAMLNDRPSGIVWCACKDVHVPELGSSIDLGPG
ncbi:MAG: GNAT family N-acetyltransferase, partial [Kofleriaceae bacterium]|nr:GNAT family N-acetyltransferase [Kofleriaceae bacterium]